VPIKDDFPLVQIMVNVVLELEVLPAHWLTAPSEQPVFVLLQTVLSIAQVSVAPEVCRLSAVGLGAENEFFFCMTHSLQGREFGVIAVIVIVSDDLAVMILEDGKREQLLVVVHLLRILERTRAPHLLVETVVGWLGPACVRQRSRNVKHWLVEVN
jgi:hypothetical protein